MKRNPNNFALWRSFGFLFLFGILFIEGFKIHAEALQFDHAHQRFANVLRRYVENGRVDYTELSRNQKELNAYLDDVAGVRNQVFKTWSQAQQIAFLINLYNAFTLRLILDHYPVESIKDIGNIFRGPWKQKMVRFLGEKVHLSHIEHDVLRAKYREPRIHFALVCAAKGCPPLREEPYLAEKLDKQLENQGQIFLSSRKKNRVDVKGKTLYLSRIFKWFREDFTKEAGSLANFVRPYFSKEISGLLEKEEFDIEYTDYDWSLNDWKAKPVRERK